MNFLESFISITQTVLEKLEEKKKEIEKHHKKCNITRTIGTSVSTTGAGLVIGGLLLAPFTAGTSLVAATGLGAALGLGGAAVNLSTEAVDFFASKSFTNQIKKMFEERNQVGERLKELFDQIEAISSALVSEGMNEDDAAANATYLVFKREMNFNQFLKIKNSELFGTGFELTFKSGGQFLSNLKQSRDIKKIMGNLGVKIGKNAAIHIVKSGSVIFSTIFVYFDIDCLIKSWKSKHPSINQVEDLIKSMNSQLDGLQNLIEWLGQASIELNSN